MSNESFTLSTRFLSIVATNSDLVAIEEGERVYTYAELRGRASAMAHHLKAAGVGPDCLVGLCGVRSLDYFVATLAISLAGGAYIPIATDTPPARLSAILKSACPKIILVDDDARHLFAAVEGCVKILSELSAEAGCHAEPPDCCVTPDSLACVLFTSGSTGTPKGVAIPQIAVVKLVCDTNYISLEAGDRVLAHSALTFDAITFETWGPLLNGSTLVVKPAGKPRLQDYADILYEKAIDTVFLTTALFRELVEWKPVSFSPLRRVLTGGEVGSADHVRRALDVNPELCVIVVYGPTECTTFTTTCEFSNASQVPDVLPLGHAINATEVRLLRSDGQPTVAGEVGEIYVGGPRISRGYLGRSDLTEAAFVFLEDGGRFYRTGDFGVIDAAGSLFFRGRSDRQIKLRGYRVELEEIEDQMRAHPSVSAAAVKVLERDDGRDPMILAYVTLNADTTSIVDSANVSKELTSLWRDVYSELLYHDLAATEQTGTDLTLNTAGWKSSYDGRHIDDAQMLEQVSQTVDRVLAVKPRRVLEVGCGTGMLLFRIAPACETYVGTDFSQVAIDYVARQVSAERLDDIVTLACCAADNLPDAPENGFDTVVINSVTEHFPSIYYLDSVLRALRDKLSPDAHVFVGDNRNYTLLPLFHASVQLFRSEGEMPLSRFALQVAQSIAEERQLTIDPSYFLQLNDLGYQCCSLQCRRGSTINEMTSFRFDAMLHFGGPRATVANVPVTSVEPDLITLIASAADQPVAIGRLRNARNRGGDLLAQAIVGTSSFATVGELRRAIEQSAPGVSPEDVWSLAEAYGIAVEVRPSIGSTSGEIDLWLAPTGSQPKAWMASARRLETLANDPARADRLGLTATALRSYLQELLPEYAMPSFIVALPHFITTAHGKIDMDALPLPERLRRRRSEVRGIEDEAKALLRHCWETVLGVYDIEENENFFELGGNSLKTVRLIAEFKELSGVSLSPVHVFEQPTLAGLADYVRNQHATRTSSIKINSAESRGRSRRGAIAHHRPRASTRL